MPRIVDHDARRAELLAGAFSLFVREGYGGVTMRGLATALGVSTGTLYHYFGGKDAIFEQMVTAVSETDVAEADALVQSGRDATERVDLTFAFATLREERLRSFIHLAFDARRHHPGGAMDDLVERAFARYRASMERQLGDVPADRRDAIFQLIVGRLVTGGLEAKPTPWDTLAAIARTLVS